MQDDKNKGLYEKYQVNRTDGKQEPNARYFVLHYDKDVYAARALWEYAEFIKEEYPILSQDLKNDILRYWFIYYPNFYPNTVNRGK